MKMYLQSVWREWNGFEKFCSCLTFRLRFNWTASKFRTQPFLVTRPELAHHLDGSQVHSIFLNFESHFQKKKQPIKEAPCVSATTLHNSSNTL